MSIILPRDGARQATELQATSVLSHAAAQIGSKPHDEVAPSVTSSFERSATDERLCLWLNTDLYYQYLGLLIAFYGQQYLDRKENIERHWTQSIYEAL